jgi:hypothetical protein
MEQFQGVLGEGRRPSGAEKPASTLRMLGSLCILGLAHIPNSLFWDYLSPGKAEVTQHSGPDMWQAACHWRC